jgi:MscS family membrane protein
MVFGNIPYLNNLSSYPRAFVIFFVLLILLRLVLYAVQKIFIKITSKTKSDLDNIILKKSNKPLTYIALLVSLIVALQDIVFESGVENIVFKILYSLLGITIGYLVFHIADLSLMRLWKNISKQTDSNLDDTIGQLVHEVLRITLILIIGIFILNIWGVEIGPFLAGLGIAGLAVALALQPTLSNIFSGISIVLDGTFKVGDVIEVNGMSGEVYQISLRTSRIKSFDNEMIIIPNGVMAGSTVKNFFQPDISIRVNLEFGVEYGVDPEYIKKIVLEEVDQIKLINKEKESQVIFLEMADSSLNFKVRFWVDDISKKWPAHQEAITRIYRRFYKEGIGIPYPQKTVWMRDEKNVKSPSPEDKKFSSVKGKYFSDFGHEYSEKEIAKEKKEEEKERKSFLRKFKFGK